jgi:hypothetical protein
LCIGNLFSGGSLIREKGFTNDTLEVFLQLGSSGKAKIMLIMFILVCILFFVIIVKIIRKNSLVKMTANILGLLMLVFIVGAFIRVYSPCNFGCPLFSDAWHIGSNGDIIPL